MHPIFRNTARLGVYFALWALLAAVLGALIRVPTGLSWSQSLSMAVPLCMFYAFVCLTPWYTCRGLPLGSPQVTKMLINQLAATVLACSLWVAAAGLLAFALDLGSRLNPAIPQL